MDPKARANFTAQLIRAIELNQSSSSGNMTEGHQLAKAAHNKLLFDFPVVSELELEALIAHSRQLLQAKSGWFPYQLTSCFVDNILSGAQRGPLLTSKAVKPSDASEAGTSPRTGAPDLNHHTQSHAAANAPMPLLRSATAGAGTPANPAGDSIHANASAAAAAAGAKTAAAAAAADDEAAAVAIAAASALSLQGAYQQLCAVVLLQVLSFALTLPEEDAWRMLSKCVVAESPDYTDGMTAEQPSATRVDAGDNSASHSDKVAAVIHSFSVAAQGGDGALAGTVSTSGRIYEDAAAAEEDGDDFVFEDLDPCPASALPAVKATVAAHSKALGQHKAGGTGGVLSAALPDLSSQPYDWQDLQRVLLQLGSHIEYTLLNADQIWQAGSSSRGAAGGGGSSGGGGGAADMALSLVRTAGVHTHARELRPLVHSAANLLCDRAAACPEPSGVADLEGLWDALGVTDVQAMPPRRRRRPPAAGVVVQGALEVLTHEASLALTLICGLAGQLSGSAVGRAALWRQVHTRLLPLLERCFEDVAAHPEDGESLAAALLTSQVVEFYVQQRPGGLNAGASLLNAGVVRGLACVMPLHGEHAAAEPLRRAALLAAANGGREVARWLQAVPGFAAAVTSGAAFGPGGLADVHGALWRVLLGGAAAAGGPAGQDQDAALVAVLAACRAQLPRLLAVLRLLQDVLLAAGRRHVWGPAVNATLEDVAAGLREDGHVGPAAAAALGAGVCGVSQSSVGSSEQTHAVVGGTDSLVAFSVAATSGLTSNRVDAHVTSATVVANGGEARATHLNGHRPAAAYSASENEGATADVTLPALATQHPGGPFGDRGETTASAATAAGTSFPDDDGGYLGDGDGDDLDLAKGTARGVANVEQLKERQARQLRPRCLRIVKELLGSADGQSRGGKTD